MPEVEMLDHDDYLRMEQEIEKLKAVLSPWIYPEVPIDSGNIWDILLEALERKYK